MRLLMLGVSALALLSLAACRKEPAAAPDAGPGPVTATPPAPAAVDAGTAPSTEWASTLNAQELKTLDTYRGFSADGLVYAYTEMSEGAGVPILSFVSVTTNTVEKTSPLADKSARELAAADLAEEKFPKPGTPQTIPPQVTVELRDGLVQVLFSGMPAAKPYRPWGGEKGLKPEKAEIVAISHDRKRVAVRVTGRGGGEFGAPAEHRVVTLFE